LLGLIAIFFHIYNACKTSECQLGIDVHLKSQS
jgi:hypothetical protein